MSRTTAIVSARMGSSRLPGKVLMDILGRPVLSWQIERIRHAPLIEEIIVATSTLERDDPIAAFCTAESFPFFRGSEGDVLDRVYQAAVHFEADPIVRLTGDDPLTDPAVIDHVVSVYLKGDYDYVSNVNPPTYPDGLDVEVIRFSTLEEIWRSAVEPADREHVTRLIRRSPNKWRTANVEHDENLSHLHWALDQEKHLDFIRRAFQVLYPKNPVFGLQDLLALE